MAEVPVWNNVNFKITDYTPKSGDETKIRILYQVFTPTIIGKTSMVAPGFYNNDVVLFAPAAISNTSLRDTALRYDKVFGAEPVISLSELIPPESLFYVRVNAKEIRGAGGLFIPKLNQDFIIYVEELMAGKGSLNAPSIKTETAILAIRRLRSKSYLNSPELLVLKDEIITTAPLKSKTIINAPQTIKTDGLVLITPALRGSSKINNPGLFYTVHVEINPPNLYSKSNIFIASFASNILSNIKWGDSVMLLVLDCIRNVKFYRGVIRNISDTDKYIDVDCILGDGLLSERKIKENYLEQDIGLSVKQIVDKYCRPITTEGVNINTGFIAPIEAENKTPVQVLEELRRLYNVYFYIDNLWDLKFYLDEEVV